MPSIDGIRWEQNARGGWEAWIDPPGAARRSDRTYLGDSGKRKLTAATPDTIREWVRSRQAEKGI